MHESIYPEAPGHRHVDTSIAAAKAILPKLGRLQRVALKAIEDSGVRGLTADELATELHMDRYSIQPRTSELRLLGLIGDSKQRRANHSRKMAIVWVSAKHLPAVPRHG